MTNYMKADLTRIFKRVPRIVIFSITFIAFCLAILIYVSVTKVLADPALAELGLGTLNSQKNVYNAIVYIAGSIMGLFGLLELIYVFSDDFRAKTAQIAIGVGVSRTKVILSKFFELVILLVVDMAVLFGLSVMMSGLMGSMLTGPQMTALFEKLAMGVVVTNVAYCSLVLVLLFTTQSMIVAVLAFLALNFHMVSGMINLSGYIKALRPLHLSSYTLTTMLEKTGNMVKGAAFNPIPVLAVAAYIVGALVITVLLYNKKELEF